MVSTVFMVAEKPSIAETISKILSNGKCSFQKGSSPIHEWNDSFNGQPARFICTSVKGHVYSTDFPPEFQNWDRVDPRDLLSAPITKIESKGGMRRHLSSEGRGCHHLVLWLDCDREGENICFEVIGNVGPVMASKKLQYFGGTKENQNVWRAKFSSLAPQDIRKAMSSLGSPNENESLSVDARQELDLKVGVAFSRFQTRHFQGKFGDLDASVISYGPCQTPTLHFVVKRYDEIETFVAEKFWTIQAHASINSGMAGKTMKLALSWSRRKCFDETATNIFLHNIKNNNTHNDHFKILQLTTKMESRKRPQALNTVSMLKAASTLLGIGPQQALSIAEHLYLSGYISYPRTETNVYPGNFDLKSTLKEVANCDTNVGQFAGTLVANNFANMVKPRHDGVDVGDHPPITPVRAANSDDLKFDEKRMYDLIARHFLATLSGDCKIACTRLLVEGGGETFSAAAREVVEKGFTAAFIRGVASNYLWEGGRDTDAAGEEFDEGDNYEDNGDDDAFMDGAESIVGLALKSLKVGELIAMSGTPDVKAGLTRPPGLITESELLGMMEKSQIGTDASMATHVNNIIERGYATLDKNSSGRRLSPTKLGVSLIHGYYSVDPELVLPSVRATIEKQVNLIAIGKAKKEEVVSHSLAMFRAKFDYFVRNIERVDSLFEASFTSLAQTGKAFSKCGYCKRFMVLIDKRPIRLHCRHCEKAYSLPEGGSIKLHQGFSCPLDGFDLVLFNLKGGRTTPLCPLCYNEPPFEKLSGIVNPHAQNMPVKAVTCWECAHPTCKHGVASQGLMPCVADGCTTGSLCLDVTSGPNWKLCCNVCKMELKFEKGHVKSLSVLHNETCEDCGARMLQVDRHKNIVPAGEETAICGCVTCDEQINKMISAAEARIFFKRGGGGGGAAARKGKKGGRRNALKGGRKKAMDW